MANASFANENVALVFGTNDPDISSEDFQEKVEHNFRVNENDTEESVQDIIDSIDSVSHMVGAFSCRRIGQDEYDRRLYNDDDSSDENADAIHIDPDNKICRSIIEGANNEVSCLHNAVTHAGKNKWRHICLNMQYLMEKGIIPNPTHPEYTAIHGNHHSSYHNFPRFFKVKRTSGDIQDARWEFNEAIKLHKSKSLNDSFERLYLRVNYLPNSDDDIHDTNNYDFLFKNVPLDDILEINPEITEITFTLFVWSDSEISKSHYSVAEVMAHYNAKHHEWCESQLVPAIKRLNSPLTINLVYESNPKYNQTIITDMN